MSFLNSHSTKELLNSDFERIVDEYLTYFALGSSHTSKAKHIDLRDFIFFLKKYRNIPPQKQLKTSHWDHSSVQAYLDNLLERGFAPASVARKLATLKHFGRTLADNVAGFSSPAKESKSPKTTLQRPKGLDPKEVKQIFNSTINSLKKEARFSEYRNNILFIFLLETGLRAEECRLLRKMQLSDDLQWIKSVRTKGRKFRNVYISSRLRPHLKLYLEKRHFELYSYSGEMKQNLDAKLPLFPSFYKARLSHPESFLMGAKTLWRAINNISKRHHLHPHLLRHTFALNLLASSKDVRLVSQALGHSDVRITMRYTQRHDEDIAQALEDMSEDYVCNDKG